MDTKLTYLYLYLISIVACLLSSCASDSPDDDPDIPRGDELTFYVGELSRSATTTNINVNGSSFAIYGNMRYRDNTPITIFDNTIVTYSNSRWSYADTQYWYPKHEFSFIALHPADATGISGTEYTDSRLSFTYTLPDDFEAAHDLLISTHRRMFTSSPATPVVLNFQHILSRVNFKLKNDGAADVVTVNEIKLENVNKTGSFAITPAPLLSDSETDDSDFSNSSWTGISNNGTIIANISVNVPENEERPLFPDDNALFMVPQPDNNDVIMHITYTLHDANAEDEQITLTAQAPIGGWKPGKIYTYSMTVCEITQEISLTVSVKNWQAPKTPTTVTVPEY